MRSIISIIDKIRADFPQFQLVHGDAFRWAPHEMKVYYPAESPDAVSLLHELSHAILNHQSFTRDIQLLGYEQAAWHHAETNLATRYGVEIDREQIEDSLDTYRDWLHARSRCPHCNATGLQIKQQLYSCLACHTRWRVNDARICGLRRTVDLS